MIAETVTETAIDFLTDAAIDAVITGAVGAVVGVTAASSLPAVIGIGIVTIGVKSVGDAVVIKVTENKAAALTEVTSDFILDTGEKLIGGAKDFFSIHSLSKALFGNVAGAMA